jgi:hypothetical protein
MRVQVYWNIRKRVWSIKDKKKQKVIDHKDSLSLSNCKFIVQQGGRERVLKEKQKNIHAFVEGDIENDTKDLTTQVTYNPYRDTTFIKKDTKEPIFNAERVNLNVLQTKQGKFPQVQAG